ncbi:J domain-containing protein [Mycobacteroides abscessus]|uniref:J domain-containing protein n=1 Tax=Mycobacteroides abscessus TaxID=36809 RepID=UPI00092AF644|nr:DnaJ domain-containing protein [Mycobacteroides abscessus]SIC59459.1 DnaJ domain [Mycobacteroides abscessus subsp. abscessus]
MIDAYPLQWPIAWPRTPEHQRDWGNLNKMPSSKVRKDLMNELNLLGATNIVISANVAIRKDGLPYAGQRVDDPGVVLYFTRNGTDVCIPCDRWMAVDANLRAIGKTVEAIRGIERWGAGDLVDAAFNGITNKALPASVIVTPYTPKAWHEVLEVSPTASAETIRAAYKAHLFKAHPDQGGTTEQFQAVQNAYKQSGAAS